MNKLLKNLYCALTFLVLLAFAFPAQAAPAGLLTTTACSDQGVTVTFTMIDWLPAGGGSGCLNTASTTNFTYTGGGPLVGGTQGQILDLTFAMPVANFMTFAGHPNLSFELLSVGPGVPNVVCPDSFNSLDAVCSVVAGSPFILRAGPGATTVTMGAFGVVHDLSGVDSPWMGSFSVDFAGITPADLQGTFLQTGTITTGHSGQFVATMIPEPGSAALIGFGLLGLAYLVRKRARS